MNTPDTLSSSHKYPGHQRRPRRWALLFSGLFSSAVAQYGEKRRKAERKRAKLGKRKNNKNKPASAASTWKRRQKDFLGQRTAETHHERRHGRASSARIRRRSPPELREMNPGPRRHKFSARGHRIGSRLFDSQVYYTAELWSRKVSAKQKQLQKDAHGWKCEHFYTGNIITFNIIFVVSRAYVYLGLGCCPYTAWHVYSGL